MESSENGGKKPHKRKLPKKKPKSKHFKHIKKHYNTLSLSDATGSSNSNNADADSPLEINNEECTENSHDASSPKDVFQPCSSEADSAFAEDLSVLRCSKAMSPCQSSLIDELWQNVMVASSPKDVLQSCSSGVGSASALTEDVYQLHSSNAKSPQRSCSFDELHIQNVMAHSTPKELRGDVIEEESVIDKVAVPREFFAVDDAEDVVVIESHPDAQPTEGNLWNTPPNESNALFQRGVVEKVACPSNGLPLYSVGDHMVIKSFCEPPGSSQLANASCTAPNLDFSSLVENIPDIRDDAFVGVIEGETDAPAKSRMQYGLLEAMPVVTERMHVESGVPDILPIHEVIRTKIEAALSLIHCNTTNCVTRSTSEDIKIGLFRATATEVLVLQRSIIAKFDGEFRVTVHGKDLPRDHDFWKEVQPVPMTSDNVNEFVENVVAVVRRLRALEICRGVEKHKPAWKDVADRGYADSNHFMEPRYTETCRSYECRMLVSSVAIKRCSECAKLYRPLLNAANDRKKETTPSKFRGDAYCKSPHIVKRLADFRKTIRRSAEEIARLTEKIDRLLAKDGVHVDEETSDSLLKVVTDEKHSGRLTDIQKLFIEHQVSAANKKSGRGMTWHPAMIKISLALRMTSKPAYEQLRGILHLPCDRTLFNYSQQIVAEDGINADIIADLAAEVRKSNLKPHQLLHLLMFDEIVIKRNLVYKKETGEMIGYTNLLPVDKEIAALNAMMDDEVTENSNPTVPKQQLATKMLSYMVVGVCSDIKGVVACHGVSSMTAETLDRLTWDVVGALEANGMPVVAMVADGASTNAKFFQLQKPMPGYPKSGATYVTPNIFDPERPVFLLSDPPHLLKTTRNCLYSSGKISKSTNKYLRLMKKNNQFLQWKTIERLYNMESQNTARKLFHINKADVKLNSYSIMNVNSAAHVLSQSTADCIRDNKWDDCEEVAVLCEKTNAVFDQMNGAYSVEGRRHRNPRLNPYERSDDGRFEEILQYWKYLEDWQNQLKATKDKNWPKYILTRQTMEGWERTTKGFCGAVKYILSVAEKNGDKAYIYARRFCQDRLEHFFGRIRGSLGGNRNPDLNEARRVVGKSHVYRSLDFGRERGNTRVSKHLVTLEELSEPLPKKQKRS